MRLNTFSIMALLLSLASSGRDLADRKEVPARAGCSPRTTQARPSPEAPGVSDVPPAAGPGIIRFCMRVVSPQSVSSGIIELDPAAEHTKLTFSEGAIVELWSCNKLDDPGSPVPVLPPVLHEF